MTIRVLAIGDSSNTLSTLKKFVKTSKIDLIDFPRKGAGKKTYISKNIEFFDSLKISKQIKKINEIKQNYDVCIVMSWAAARIAYLTGLNYIMYFTGNDIKTPPFIKIDSTANGKELTSTSILSTTFLIFTKGKSGSEIKR